jgi:F-type H+-transporting ATPase subunit delta
LKDIGLARRYSRALFTLALERDLVDKIHQELNDFSEILRGNQKLGLFLNAPQVDRSDKRNAIEKLFQDRFSNVFFNFLMLLIEKGRQGLIPRIVHQFEALYDAHRNRVRAVAISALPLADSELARLRRALAERLQAEVMIDNQVDPSIIGGLVVKIQGQVLDGSIRHQLGRLEEQLLDRRN